MRKVVATEYVTLDGVMQAPGDAKEFERGGWSFQFWSEEAAKFKFDELFASDALLLGRITYQGFAAAWPSRTDEYGFADRMNNLPKYVVSTTLQDADATWNNTHIIRDNIAEAVANLKQQPGQDILLAGSADLVQALMRHNLIDEYRLMVHPIILGAGKRLFQDGADTKALKLASTQSFRSGILVLSYELAPQNEKK